MHPLPLAPWPSEHRLGRHDATGSAYPLYTVSDEFENRKVYTMFVCSLVTTLSDECFGNVCKLKPGINRS
jgi:hypothetical protein